MPTPTLTMLKLALRSYKAMIKSPRPMNETTKFYLLNLIYLQICLLVKHENFTYEINFIGKMLIYTCYYVSKMISSQTLYYWLCTSLAAF